MRAETNAAGPANIYAAVIDAGSGVTLAEVNALGQFMPTDLAWGSTSFVFTATGTSNILAFDSIDPLSGPLIDDVRVQEITRRVTPGIYFLPEESLSAFRGENAFGDWKLEIWDSRAGGVSTNATLLAWRLNINYVNTNAPAIALTNGIEYCATLRTNEMVFFRTTRLFSSQAVTNELVSTSNGEST